MFPEQGQTQMLKQKLFFNFHPANESVNGSPSTVKKTDSNQNLSFAISLLCWQMNLLNDWMTKKNGKLLLPKYSLSGVVINRFKKFMLHLPYSR